MSFEEFQDGGHRNGTNLAILKLCVTGMSSMKFWLHPNYGLGGDIIWPSWISERNDFSNSESLCHCDASHQVSAQLDLQFGRCRLKNFKMDVMAAIFDIRTERL